MGAGKRYSAGAIFLQVIPVFANVQRAIESEAKNIDRALGDQMEKSGDKAGRRAGKAASKSMNEELSKGSSEFEREFRKNVDGINDALGGIDTKKLSNNLRREVAEIKRDLRDLKNVDMTVDADFRQAEAKVAELEGRLRALRDNAKIVFRSDIDNALKGFAKIEAAKEAIKDPVEIKVSADTRTAERQMSSFERSFKKTAEKAASHLSGSMHKEVERIRLDLKALENLRIGVDISANRARAELAELMAELKTLSRQDPNIDVKVDTGRAFAELAVFEAALEKIDHKKIHIDTDGATKGMGLLASSGDDAANTFRSFNFVILAVTAIGPALIPILGAMAGGLLAIGPAAAVAAGGLGAVLVGFSGIGGALQALQAKQDAMTKTTQTAAKQEESAARRVADARRSAARAVESALERQKSAQERYAKSIQDVKDAEQALKEARDAAKDDGKDIVRRQHENQLAIDQALLDEFNATVNFQAVSADGSATNAEKEQARIDMEQAKLHMEELRQEAKDLAAEKKKWDEQGVNGTDAVKNAQDALTSAIEQQKKAYEELKNSARDVDRARADGARQVKEALDAQAESLAAVNTQQANVDAAMSKLGLTGRKFALFLFGLRDEFYAFRDDIQRVLLPAVQEAMEGFFKSKNAKLAKDAVIALAGSFGKFVEALSKSFQGPAWGAFFQMLADLGPKIQAAYGDAFIKFMEALASMLTTLAPYALTFAKSIERVMTAFANWAASKDGQEALRKFMDWAAKTGPDVVDALVSLAGAAANLVVALAPWGTTVLRALTGILNFLAGLDPHVLEALATAMLVLVAASQVAYGLQALALALQALGALSLGPWVVGLILVAAALAGLYAKNEKFRKFVKKAWKEISHAFKEAWDKYIQPALADLWDAVKQLWDEVLQPFFEWLGPIILWVAVHLIPILARYFAFMVHNIAFVIRHILVPAIKGVAHLFGWLWKNVLHPTWNAIHHAAVWLWKKALKPAFEGIGDLWHGLMKGMKWVWTHVLHPVFNFIADTALPKLENAFQTVVDAIKTIWDGLKKVVGAPIKFVLDTIINNGLIDGFNKVASWVHMDGIKHIPIPKALQSYATGGVMPGYTPGRDVHAFYSPTAGRLELSGGEAVMRPEWTAAMGAGYVNQMNAIARSKGVSGIRKMMGMGGFAKGGILPHPDDKIYINGMAISRVAAAQIALAKKMFATDIYMMQGGFGGNHIAASGTSHNYPGVGDFGPGSTALEKVLRQVGFAAWARNVPGRSQVGSGAHVHAASLLDPGNRRDPQIYGSWAHHGNGLSGYNNDPAPHYAWIPGLLSKVARMGVGEITSLVGADGKGGGHRKIPGWLISVIKNPLAAVKNWITGGWDKASNFVTDSPVWDVVKKVPLLAAKKVTDKVWDIVPGWAKTAVGWAGDGAEWVVGGVKNAGHALAEGASNVGHAAVSGAEAVGNFLGFARGGILPYNGTMKYDNGGYLPPGLTSVVNLTGKPEPVFTADQWDGMGGGTGGGNIHYEPHFEGSNLTAEDVASDLNFTFRRMRRGGKYAGVGDR